MICGTLLISLWLLNYSSIEAKLTQIQVVFRHGDRAPVASFPLDPVKSNAWPDGLGQLTDVGIKQHYQLGKLLQERYKDLLGKNYSHKNIYVRSTDVDRTLMSAEANLAGLFSDTKEIIPGMKWRPIPVHTINASRDFLLSGQDNCPEYRVEVKQMLNTPYFVNKLKPYRELMNYIQIKSGLTFLNMSNFFNVYDTLLCEKIHKKTIANWVDSDVWKRIKEINMIDWEVIYSTLRLNQMAAGVLLNQILEHLSMARTNSSLQPKVFVYSAHDTDVAPLYHLLNVPDINFGQPGYASSIIIELHVDDMQNSNYQVKAWYGDTPSLTGEPWKIHQMKLDVEGCTDLDAGCPLDRFLNAMQRKSITKHQFKQFCYKSPSNLPWSYSSLLYAMEILVISVVGIIVVLMMYVTCKYKMLHTNTSRSNYAYLNDREKS